MEHGYESAACIHGKSLLPTDLCRYSAVAGWHASVRKNRKVVLDRGFRIHVKKCIGSFSGHMSSTPQELAWREEKSKSISDSVAKAHRVGDSPPA